MTNGTRYTPFYNSRQKLGQRHRGRIGKFLAGLGLSSAIALTTLLLLPPALQAYPSRVGLFVVRRPEDSYPTFLQKAEAIARAGIQRTFDEDLLISEVIVTVVGENQGIAVPLMEIQVTRSDWEQRPDPQYFAEYYKDASALLGF